MWIKNGYSIPSEKYNVHVYIYTKSKKNAKHVHIQITRHFEKINTICVTFLYTKDQTLYVTRFFMKILKLSFIYKNNDTLLYVTFLYTKDRHFEKSKTISLTFLYTKIRTPWFTRFFMKVLKLAEGGRIFLYAKKCTLCYILYEKKCTLRYVFIYKNHDTLRYIFKWKKCTSSYVLYLKLIV